MDMRFITSLWVLFFSWAAHAGSGVFMCSVDGEMVFRDHPCQATTVEKVEKSPEQLEEERQVKAQKEEELQSISDSNDSLKAKLEKLEQQRDVEVSYYQEKIERYSSTEMTDEKHGLVKKIKDLKKLYKSQTSPLELEIQQNQEKIEALESLLAE